MFEKIMLFKIMDPRSGEISNVFVENAEKYNKIMQNQFIRSCIIKKEDAYIYHDVPEGWKLYDCPGVYLTEEEKEEFEQMLNELTDTDYLDKGMHIGTNMLVIGNKSDIREYLRLLKHFLRQKLFPNQDWVYYGKNEVALEKGDGKSFLQEFGMNYFSSKPATRKRVNNHPLV